METSTCFPQEKTSMTLCRNFVNAQQRTIVIAKDA